MKALRIHIKQSSANYRREETIDNKMTYPLPPYSTVIGALHKACNYTSYHDMKLSIQGSYSGMKKEVYLNHCYLNSLQNDRGILIKVGNSDIMSNGYIRVAEAKNGQGNDFYKGVTIEVFNQRYLDEYRTLKNLNDQIAEFKKKRFNPLMEKMKERKKKLDTLKNDSTITDERRERVVYRLNELKNNEKDFKQRMKSYEKEYYQKPISYFKTLTRGPMFYEVLYDVDLIIHVHSDDETLKSIYDNIGNLTSIGRREDFVQVEECEFTELERIDSEYESVSGVAAYVPVDFLDSDGFYMKSKRGVKAQGTRYLLNKDYMLSNDRKKRIFNKRLVAYVSEFAVDEALGEKFQNVFIDHEKTDYIVSLI